MKLPDGPWETGMIAPCGMDCTVCYKHCAALRPCQGCTQSDAGKPAHCRACRIKECVREKEVVYCHACPQYPCARIRRLDRSYRARYNASLIENGSFISEQGEAAFMAMQKQRYTCPHCGGVISLHDAACSECGQKAE